MAEKFEGMRIKPILLDVKEWEQLGEKVGEKGRSAWIRNAIHEEVKLPDDIKVLNVIEDDLFSQLERVQNRKASILEKQETAVKTIEEGKTVFETAVEECKKLIVEEHKQFKTKTIDRKELGIDIIEEQADLYQISKDDLEAKLRTIEDLKIIKTQKVPIPKETGKTLESY